jgi:hypothetical protein
VAVPSGPGLFGRMSGDTRAAIASAYTPSHMNVARQRQSVGMTDAFRGPQTLGTQDGIVSRADTGTRLLPAPYLRERSVE